MYCHKCGAGIHKESLYCSNCGVKVETVSSTSKNYRRTPWVLPVVTFFAAFVVIGSYFILETNASNDLEDLFLEGEKWALEGELMLAKRDFEQVLEKRPNHIAAAFNLEVVERGLHYKGLIDEAVRYGKLRQFDEGLHILEELERELANEDGLFFDRFKEQHALKTASLTVTNVGEDKHAVEQLVLLFKKIENYTSEEAIQTAEVLKRKIIENTTEHGKYYLEKNQFTEAEAEFKLGLSYEPTNEKLLAYKEAVKTQRIAFEKEEQKRLDKALSKAAEEEDFNWTKAVKLLSIEFNYDDQGKLHVWGEVKNVGTRPISEIDIHYAIFDEESNELTISVTGVTTEMLMPNETGYFEEYLLSSETIVRVEIVDYFWTVK